MSLFKKHDAAPTPAWDRNENPDDWTYVIEAIDPSVLGRYRIYLVVELFMHYGYNDGWGWGAWTLAGAHRKGARQLELYRRRAARLAGRQRHVNASMRLPNHTDGSSDV